MRFTHSEKHFFDYRYGGILCAPISIITLQQTMNTRFTNTTTSILIRMSTAGIVTLIHTLTAQSTLTLILTHTLQLHHQRKPSHC